MKNCIKKIILFAYIVGIIFPMNAGAIAFDQFDSNHDQVVSEHAEEDVEIASGGHSSEDKHCEGNSDCKGCAGCEGGGHCLCAAGCSPSSSMTVFDKSHALSFSKLIIDFSLFRENTQQSFLQKIFRPPRP